MWKLLIVLGTFDAHLMLLMSRIHFYSKLVTQQTYCNHRSCGINDNPLAVPKLTCQNKGLLLIGIGDIGPKGYSFLQSNILFAK
jgi:hypothetical protein